MLETGGPEKSFPDHLFRYRPSDTTYFMEEVEKALFQQSVFVSNCQTVNDPFDFSPTFEESKNAELIAFISKHKIPLTPRVVISEHSGKFVSRNEYRHRIRHLKKPLLRVRYENDIARTLWREARESGGMACFSETMSSLPMWAHYAGNHTGACLAFRWSLVEAIKDEIEMPMKVEYAEARPRVSTIDLLATSSRGKFNKADEALRMIYMTKMYLTKGKDWEYEREWRVFTSSGPTGRYRRIPSLVLSGIILGYKMKPELRDEITKRFGSHIEVLQAIPCGRDYAIRVEPIA